MKKRILSALTSLALTATCFAQAAAAPMLIASAADTSYEVGKVAANAGETVSVPVYVSGDTGTSGIVVSLEADDRLSYAGQADGNAYTGDVVWNSEDLYWVFSTGEGEEQTAADGAVMFTVDFKVPENAQAGDEFPISLNVDEVVDTNGTLLEVDTVAGMIYIPDGDGSVTYTVDTVEGEAGQNVTVPVYVTGDTGTAGIIVGLTAHEGLTLAGESDGNAYTGDTVWNEDDLYWVFATEDGANQKAADDAVMFNVTFTVPDDAQPGDEFPIEFAVAEAVDTIGTPLNVTTVNGKIVIPDAIVTDPAGSVTYTVDTVEGEAGQDVTVPVYVTGDTGTSGIIIGLTADSRLTLKGESDGAAYTGDVVWNEDDLYWVFATEDGGNQKAADDAVMFNVTFTVPDDAQPGDEFPIEFAVAEAVDTFGTDLTVTTVNGKIVIPDAIVTDPAGSVTYTVDTVEGAAGADVIVPVYVTGDTGTSGIIIGLTADSRLTLKGESDGAAYTGDVVW
ncbi:MAG: hypothetical protein IJY85_02350, partial [Ruminococcus sp.]|nr:hypothetical protein [Ruminococcus sp.]